MKKKDLSTAPYKTIGEIAKDLNLVDKKTGRLQTHTIRYWEKQFKQIKPSVRAGNRRYYSKKDLNIIKLIKFLLKDRGFTIIGAKKILNNKNADDIDENNVLGVYKPGLKNAKLIKDKVRKISKIINELKDYKKWPKKPV